MTSPEKAGRPKGPRKRVEVCPKCNSYKASLRRFINGTSRKVPIKYCAECNMIFMEDPRMKVVGNCNIVFMEDPKTKMAENRIVPKSSYCGW